MLPNIVSMQSRHTLSPFAPNARFAAITCESSDLLACVHEVLRDCCQSRARLNPGTPAMEGAAGLLRKLVSAQTGHTFVGCPWTVAKLGFVAIQAHRSLFFCHLPRPPRLAPSGTTMCSKRFLKMIQSDVRAREEKRMGPQSASESCSMAPQAFLGRTELWLLNLPWDPRRSAARPEELKEMFMSDFYVRSR